MKLRSLIEKIGFSKHLSKSVEDVAADKFEDFGINVGQLYQTFLKKDLSADPAIAQKIMDMVDTDDDNALTNQIKDLAFLINQLPDKLEKKDKIGFREITYRPKGEDPDKGAELKTNKIKLKDLTPESYHPINSPIDLIDKDILDIPDGSVGEIKRAAIKLGIDPQNRYESELRDEIDELLTSAMSDEEEMELFINYFGDYADEIAAQHGLELYNSKEHPHDLPPDDKGIEEIDALHENEEYCPKCVSKMKEVIKESIEKIIEKEKPGLWANIRAKRARVGKKGMAKKGSEAYKTAKKAGDKINKDVDEAKTKPAKGKRFAKKVKGKGGRTRTVSYGQAGKAKKGGDRIRPGTKKGHAYCARSAKIKKCKNPPCANALSRKKWKCQGSRSVPE